MMDSTADDHGEIRSVGRALDLLEIMQRAAPAGIRVRDAASHLGVDPATASRLLATLITRGYASRMPNRRYTLGARSLRLAAGWIDRSAPGGGCADDAHCRQLRRDGVSAPTRRREAVTLARLAGTRRAHGRCRSRAELSALGDGRRPGVARYTCRGARSRAVAAGAIPRLHAAHQDDLGGRERGDYQDGRRNGMHAEEGEIDLSPKLLRHSALAQRSRRETGARRQLRGRGARRTTVAPSSRRCGGNGGNSPGRI